MPPDHEHEHHQGPPSHGKREGTGYEPSNADLFRYMEKRFDSQDKKHNEFCERLEVVETSLVGSLATGKQGIANRLRTAEKQIALAKKVLVTFMLGAIGTMGAGLWAWLKSGVGKP